MKLYHGTTQEAWESIKKKGYIFSKKKDIYTNVKPNVAKSYGDVVLEINIDDNILKDKIDNDKVDYRKSVHDYIFYEKIPISLVKLHIIWFKGDDYYYSEDNRFDIIKATDRLHRGDWELCDEKTKQTYYGQSLKHAKQIAENIVNKSI